MKSIEYPKIETLYNRNPKTFGIITSEVRLPEFANVKYWHITEKIDGTNVRVMWDYANKMLTFGGRTANAQMPVTLLLHLQATFTPEIFSEFTDDVILFGEGYGEKIQNGGDYRKGVSFRLFDVMIGSWWMEPENIKDIAQKMNCDHVPFYGVIDYLPVSIEDLRKIDNGTSITAHQDGGKGCLPEGIVARSYPLMLTRRGDRIMWKLKYRDFREVK